MFKDFNLFIGKEKKEISYKIQNGKIIVQYEAKFNEGEEKIIHFYYDENIYKVNGLEKYNVVKNSGSIIELLLEDDEEVSLEVEVNYKYFVKSVYQFINEFIKSDLFQSQIEFYIMTLPVKKEKESLEALVEKIKIIRENFGYERAWGQIHDLVLENETYKKYAKKMDALDLLLLITWYISASSVPSVSQELFNKMVSVGKTYEHPLETLWRLAMSYDERGYDFSLIDQFFLDAKKPWYFLEYLSGVEQVNSDAMVDKLIATNDKKFIKAVYDEEYAKHFFDEKTLKRLKENF